MVIAGIGNGLAPVRISDLLARGKLGPIGMQERPIASWHPSLESELGKGTAVIVGMPLE